MSYLNVKDKKVYMKKGIKIFIVIILLMSVTAIGFGTFYQDRINVLVFGGEGNRTDTMI